MMSFINKHMEDILKPFAMNVEELHKTVINIADNVRQVSAKVDANSSHIAEHGSLLEGLRKDHDSTLSFAKQTRKMLDDFINVTNTNAEATKAKFDKLDNKIAVSERAIEELRQRTETTCQDVARCQDTDERLRTDFVRSQAQIDRITHTVESLDKAHENTIVTVSAHKKEFDQHVFDNQSILREQRELAGKFDIINEHCESRFKKFDERNTEVQRQLLAFRKEIHTAHDATAQLLCGRIDAHDVIHDETRAKVNKLDVNIANHTARTVENAENFNKLIKMQEQRFTTDINDVRRVLGDATAGVSKHKRQIQELEVVVGYPHPADTKNKIALVEDEQDLAFKRSVRLEKILGLEPLTKENADADGGLQLKNGILLTDSQIKHFEETFARFDADGSGNISTKEVGDVLTSLGHAVSMDIVQILVDEIDADKSGEISFDEFCSLMSKMLGPDGKVDVDSYMAKMTDAAAREKKQNEIVEKFPKVQEEVHKHYGLIQVEKERIDNANLKIESSIAAHEALVEEVKKLQKITETQGTYWKGLSRGIKETKRTAQTEGEGELVPSHIRLRQMLPSLSDRPGTHSGAMTARPGQSGGRMMNTGPV